MNDENPLPHPPPIRASVNMMRLNPELMRKDGEDHWLTVILHPREDARNHNTDGVVVENTTMAQRKRGIRGKAVGSWEFVRSTEKAKEVVPRGEHDA